MIWAFGDSHIRHIKKVHKKYAPNMFSKITIVSGLAVSGLGKHQNNRNPQIHFDENKKVVSRNTPIIISLGEVDCGYLFWIHKESINKQIKESIKKYIQFLTKIQKQYKTVFALTVPPPTPVNYATYWCRKKSANIKFNQRKEATKNFNDQLIKNFKNAIDITSPVLDSSGSVKNEYIPRDEKGKVTDHHLIYKKYGPIIIDKIREYI